jgi:hypothetical protein
MSKSRRGGSRRIAGKQRILRRVAFANGGERQARRALPAHPAVHAQRGESAKGSAA